MKYLSLVYLLPIVGLASSPAVAELPNMQEGLWEVTTKVEISGQTKPLPEYTVQHCVTKKDIEQGKGKLHQPNSRKCQVQDYKVEGNKASWAITCSGDNPTTGTGTVTYSGTSFAGTSKMVIGKKGQEREMTQTFSGKRLGPCKQ